MRVFSIELDLDLKKWIEKGFSRHEAYRWSVSGFKLNEAINWRDHGFSLVDAQYYRMESMAPEDALNLADFVEDEQKEE